MNILVTGGAGYVGHYVTEKLLANGHTVTVLDNLSYGDAGLKEFYENENFKFIKGDIGDLKALVKAVKGQDAVIALAAVVGDPACKLDEDETIKTNYLATKCLVDVCEHYKVKRVVFASSCSVYGDTKDSIATEESGLNPLSLYAETRVMSEKVLLDESRSISPVILRLSTVFGASERMRFDLVVNFLTASARIDGSFTIFGGDQWRPNVNVEDAASAFCQSVFLDEDQLQDSRIFNVGIEENNLTIEQIGEEVINVIPNAEMKLDKTSVDKRNYRASFAKLREVFDVSDFKTVRQGVEDVKHLFDTHKIANHKDDIYYNAKYLYKEKI